MPKPQNRNRRVREQLKSIGNNLFARPFLDIRQMDDWRTWELLNDLQYMNIIVPAGFVSDGASVPRFLWALLPTTGPYMAPAFIHDYLLQRIRLGTPHSGYPTRATANKVFHSAMIDWGVNRATAGVMYSAVSLVSEKSLNDRLMDADRKRRERRD